MEHLMESIAFYTNDRKSFSINAFQSLITILSTNFSVYDIFQFRSEKLVNMVISSCVPESYVRSNKDILSYKKCRQYLSVLEPIADLLQVRPYWGKESNAEMIDQSFLMVFLLISCRFSYCSLSFFSLLHITLFTVWQKFSEKVSKWWAHSRCWIKQALFSGPWEVCMDQRNPGVALQMTCSKTAEDMLSFFPWINKV